MNFWPFKKSKFERVLDLIRLGQIVVVTKDNCRVLRLNDLSGNVLCSAWFKYGGRNLTIESDYRRNGSFDCHDISAIGGTFESYCGAEVSHKNILRVISAAAPSIEALEEQANIKKLQDERDHLLESNRITKESIDELRKKMDDKHAELDRLIHNWKPGEA